MNTQEKKKNPPKKADKNIVNERERYKGKMDRQEKKARATAGKARSKKAGHETVSDQKSHEFH
jgi:hypothetical protein